MEKSTLQPGVYWLFHEAKIEMLAKIEGCDSPAALGFLRGRRRFAILLSFLLVVPAGALDKVRVETNVDAAIAKYGVSGKGVLVAILDRGIDWLNNDFRNQDGTTRIAAIFDLTDDTGAHAGGNIYGMGTLYTRAQINAALQGGTALATRDAVGHGTATAGIAVGNGRNSTGGKYRGIAPNATILIVKITSDGAPAHGDQPAEAAFYDASRIPVAIDFVRAQATALAMPSVMLLNLGTLIGPTDGTSSLARKIDSVVGPGIPGLVFVTGTGDDGGMPNRAGGTVGQGASTAIQIQKGISGALYFDLWYAGTDRFDVTIASPSTTYGPYVSPATNNNFDNQTTSDFNYYQLGSNVTFFGAQNGKREIYIQINGPAGNYTITLQGRSVTSGRYYASINLSQFWNPPYDTDKFLNHVVPGSIWDGATAHNNIAPNCYTIRTSWTDIDGFQRSLTGDGNPGEIWPGSSSGPTFDGRLGVDVSAPGEEVVTAYNPKSYWATFRFNLINDGNGLYGMGGAVSAAAPTVTGIIALMLEMNPQLDAASVKSLLHNNARADSFTGTVPNTTWGYGKIDALRVLDSISQSTVGAVTLNPSPLNFGTAANGSLITSAQTASIMFTGNTRTPWTATPSSSNIAVSPTSGTGTGAIQISVNGPGANGTVTVAATGSVNSPQQVQVNIATVTPGSPFGSFDTPIDKATGVAGAIPVTGWALDNIEVVKVDIWREPVPNEAAGSNGLVYIGDAVFVAGARPDVQAAYPALPFNYRAGWGYQMLTNFLPNTSGSGPSGDGTYKLHAIAHNKVGTAVDLGTKTITVDNAHASKPFGTIDTPGQGGTASGNAYLNFGWALTQNPNMVPLDASTITVVVDGQVIGHPIYNNFRADIATLFPGYMNSGGAVGYFYLDTTKLSNGVHTISWNVFDNVGHGDGIGSRYFNVFNSGSGMQAAPEEAMEPFDGNHAHSVEIEELGRLELPLGAINGYQLVNGERVPLPTGSSLKRGVFYWEPGPGFLGGYELVFERKDGTETHVRVGIRAKTYTRWEDSRHSDSNRELRALVNGVRVYCPR
jgi:hypothetical protein